MTDITLDALRLRERELEIDAVLIRGRILEVRANIEELQRRRGGRPRKGDKAAAATITPLRVTGDRAEPEANEHGELPSIDDVRGILKENVG